MRSGIRALMFPYAATILAAAACVGSDSTSPGKGTNDLGVRIATHQEVLVVGRTVQLSATVSTRAGTAASITPAWVSRNPGVASVSSTGLVTGLTLGRAQIIASAGGAADTTELMVSQSPVAITVTPNVLSVPSGDTLRLLADIRGAATAPVTWTSSDSLVAVVGADGVMTALAAGDATLTAQAAGAQGSAAVRVTPNPVAFIVVRPLNNTIYVGEKVTLSATAYDAVNRELKGAKIAWSSSDPKVASVTDRGVVTARVQGSVTITASADGRRASATVNVLPTPVASVAVTLSPQKLSVGQKGTASATLMDVNGDTATGRTIAWQSSNPAIVTVTSSGSVTAVISGSVTVSAISEGRIGSASLVVVQAQAASIEIIPSTVSVRVGETAALAASVKDADGGILTNRPLSWSSANPAVATVSSSGSVSGMSAGTTSITVSSDGVTGSANVTVTTVPVAAVQITGPTQMNVGETAQTTATARDASGNLLSDRVASWSSDQPAIAAVSPTGVVSGLSAGTAIITATIEGKAASMSMQVVAPPPAPVASVVVSLSASSILVGQTAQATAVLKDASGNVLSGRSVTWSTADAELATISASGLVTAKAPGAVTVTATSEGKAGLAALSVSPTAPAPVATVTLSASATSLTVGQTTQLAVTLKDASGATVSNRTITWATSDDHVATVSPGGLVTALGAGSATISATSEGKTGSVAITVMAPTTTTPTVASVQVTLASSGLTVDQTTQATVVLRDIAGNILSGRTVTWTSSNTAVASVSAAGLVTAVGAGSATISAAAEGKSGQATLAVTAPPTPTTGHSWYASPTGSAVGAGTRSSPWSLTTALSQPGVVQPGDTIWLLGGTYRGDFTSRLTGSADLPIVLRQAPGERATIDGWLHIEGRYAYYWGFEVTYSDPRRVTSMPGSDPTDVPRESKSVFVSGAFNKLVNMVIHDLGDGVFSGLSGESLEIYGSIIYNNGWLGPDRGHGHNVYLQNGTPTKYVTDNVLFNSFSSGLHIYGSDAASLWYFSVEGNTIFESASPVTREFGADANIRHQGAGGKFGRSVYRLNSIYQRVGSNQTVVFGAGGDPPGEDIQFLNNVVQGRPEFHEVRRYTVTGNKLTSGTTPLSGQYTLLSLRMVSGEAFSSHTWDRNSYAAPQGNQDPFYLIAATANIFKFDQWRQVTHYDANGSYTTGTFTGVDVIVRRNKYEAGRATVTCWNWSGAGSLDVDLSSVLQPGDRFVIHHVYDLFGTPVTSGTYAGGSVSIPQSAVVPPTPLGYSYTPAPTGPAFGVFLVRKVP